MEFCCVRSFTHQDLMSHFKTHFRNIEPVDIRNELKIFVSLIFFNEITPFFLGDEFLLVDGIEENKYATTCSLDNS